MLREMSELWVSFTGIQIWGWEIGSVSACKCEDFDGRTHGGKPGLMEGAEDAEPGHSQRLSQPA